jgi:peptide/nickel transport system substrate-binding protein
MLRSRALTSLFAAVLLAAGCRQAAPERERAAGPGSTEPRRGGTVVTGWNAEPGGVNQLIQPNSQVSNELLFRIFLHLAEEQPDFEEHPPTFKPLLAKSWDWSPDHKVLTFHLRDGVVWSDGVPVTAEDVRWSWQAQRDPVVAWDNAVSKRWISDVEVVDPKTVRFHFERAYARQFLDANEGLILPKHAWEKLPFSQWRQSGDWFRQHLVVDGPFTIASWEPQQQIVMQRNERYFEPGFPRLDRVVMRQVPDPATAFTQLLNGELDFYPQIAVADVPRAKSSPRLQVISYWTNLYVGIAWNNDNVLFKDPEVRRALTLATDRQAIVQTLLGPYGRVADSPIPSTIWAHDKSLQPWPYDPAEARRILAARGWRDSDGDGVLDKDGRPFAFELINNAGNRIRADAAVMIQEQLKKVGIRSTPRQVEFNTLMAQTKEGKYDACVIGYSVDTGMDLTTNFHSSSIGDGNNGMRYRNPEADRLMDTGAGQPDIGSQKLYLDKVQQILHHEQPVTFLWESQRPTAVNKRVHGARPNAMHSLFHLQDWWVDQPQG